MVKSTIKKTILIIICCILLGVISVSGAMAILSGEYENGFFSAEDGEDFIEQKVMVRSNQSVSFEAAELEEFFIEGVERQLIPIVEEGENFEWNIGVKTAQDHIVFVKNNSGVADIYVRTIFAFECDDMTVQQFNDTIGLVKNTQQWTWSGPVASVIDGQKYFLITATYNGALEKNTSSLPSLMQVMLKSGATNEDIARIDSTDGKMTIATFSQAVQVFENSDVNVTLDGVFGEVTEGYNPWNSTE